MIRTIKALSFLSIVGWCSLSSAQPDIEATPDGVRIADLGLATQIPSAIDLVGPEGGAAGRNRTAVAHRLQCWIDGIERCSVADRNDPRVLAIRRFLGRGIDGPDGAVIVHFPDRTRVEVRLVRADDPGPDARIESAYAPVVLPHTAHGPGLPAVPSLPGQLDGFAYEGSPEIHAALKRLEQRLGR
ncbi:hypothetical protein [Halomonas denitrificans]|nr:hypothetical protein [Halomonas denitrificans]